MNKFTALLLIFSLMAISCTTISTQRQKRFESSKERKHGAELIITKKEGRQIKGELITVKPNSLLLLNTEGKDVSVDIADINIIKIVKKSKALLGAGLGVLALGVVPFSVVAIFDSTPDEPMLRFIHAGLVGLLGGLGGLLIGAIIGAHAGTDETIRFEGMTESEIQEALDYLRKKARIRNYK